MTPPASDFQAGYPKSSNFVIKNDLTEAPECITEILLFLGSFGDIQMLPVLY